MICWRNISISFTQIQPRCGKNSSVQCPKQSWHYTRPVKFRHAYLPLAPVLQPLLQTASHNLWSAPCKMPDRMPGLPLLLPHRSMVPLFRASALEVRLCGGSIYPLCLNMDGWMWRDGRVMKSNKQASHGGEVTVVDRSLWKISVHTNSAERKQQPSEMGRGTREGEQVE